MGLLGLPQLPSPLGGQSTFPPDVLVLPLHLHPSLPLLPSGPVLHSKVGRGVMGLVGEPSNSYVLLPLLPIWQLLYHLFGREPTQGGG